jgi:hypothetical protein
VSCSLNIMHFVIQATVGCFSPPAAAGLARPVSIQIWALRSRLEKPPTDPASAGGGHHCMPDGALAGSSYPWIVIL